MKQRLNKLKELVEEIKSDSFSDQYHFADSNKDMLMEKLSNESAFYQKILKQIELLLK